jgi:hypothetical protein
MDDPATFLQHQQQYHTQILWLITGDLHSLSSTEEEEELLSQVAKCFLPCEVFRICNPNRVMSTLGVDFFTLGFNEISKLMPNNENNSAIL